MNKLLLSAFFCGVFICCSIETIAQKKKENPNLWKISILEEIIEHYKKEGRYNG